MDEKPEGLGASQQTKKPLLQALAAEVYECAEKITRYCDDVHHPQVSFEAESPPSLLPDAAPDSLVEAQQRLLGSLNQIQQLALDIADFLPQHQVYVSYHLLRAAPSCFVDS